MTGKPAAALVMLALAVTGCGSASQASVPLSADDRLCVLDALGSSGGRTPSPEEAAACKRLPAAQRAHDVSIAAGIRAHQRQQMYH